MAKQDRGRQEGAKPASLTDLAVWLCVLSACWTRRGSNATLHTTPDRQQQQEEDK